MLANRTLDHAYDAVGNRILETTDGFPVASTYDANDRLQIQGAVTYSYDDDGNTLQKSGPSGTTAYTYDELNRLKTITGPGTTSSYAYDHDSQRVESIENGTTTRYLIDGNRRFAQVLEERDGSNTLQAHYAWGTGLIRQQRGATTSYYHHDGHGSVRALTDAAEAVTDTYDYDAYGGLQSQTGTTENSYRYAGEQFVEGLGGYYLRARYYQPGAGRFLTRDEFAGFARNPISLNKYLYANANPVMGVDPSGRFTLLDVQTAQASIAYVRTGLNVAAFRVLQFATVNVIKIAGASALVTLGSRIPSLLRGAGPRGIRALQAGVRSQARLGQTVSQSKAESAHHLGRNAREGLNTLLDLTKNPPGIQYHHIVEQANRGRFGSKAIDSIANIAPTPAAVHTQLSALFKRGISLPNRSGSISFRDLVSRLSFGDQWRVGSEVWVKAMSKGGARVEFGQLSNEIQQLILSGIRTPPPG